MPETFPQQQARTRRFSLGVPRSFTVAGDGSRVLFLRSPADSGALGLWELDVESGAERLLVDPSDLGGDDVGPEERARRERRRELAGGITAYSADAAAATAVFVVAGRLWSLDVASGASSALPVDGPVFDPTVDPTGTTVAWCAGADLRVAAVDGSDARVLAAADGDDVTWGQAEFVAAEEMGRDRGFWWAPDGRSLLVARVDVVAVGTWWVTDPAHPERPPVAHRYPAAGTDDAAVTLWWTDLTGARRPVEWDRDRFPYLTVVRWGRGGPPLLLVEARDHRACSVLTVDVATGATSEVAGAQDRAWVSWPPGLPDFVAGGALAWCRNEGDDVRLTVDGDAVTPPGLEVRSVVGTDDGLLVRASADPRCVDLWRWTPAGAEQVEAERVALDGPADGVVGVVAAGGGTVVVSRRTMESTHGGVTVLVAGRNPLRIRSLGEEPVLVPDVRFLRVGPDGLRCGLLLPRGHVAGTPLPVLLYPYGGPGAQRVVADLRVWLESQWRADQGFAVLVADGHGTPGRGPVWERSVHGDLATAVLADQVLALQAAAAECPDLDLTRVGITGWSFGGYLAALAVLRRPEVFHAAVAGAPVTDWRLYDTYYTERFLGHPAADPGAYDRSSLIDEAPALRRPLLLVHGLVDDNVVVAHTLRLSQALLEAGRPHSVLPLTGVTHVASRDEVEARLLELQMGFLVDALG